MFKAIESCLVRGSKWALLLFYYFDELKNPVEARRTVKFINNSSMII